MIALPQQFKLVDTGLPERHEFVDGVLVKKAMPSYRHGKLQWQLCSQLDSFQGPRDRRSETPGGWWFATECEIEFFGRERYVPDLAGWRIARVPEEPADTPVKTAPSWVCEILSPSTAKHDLGHKRDIYYQARVSHYWLLDPDQRTLSILRWAEDGYQTALVASPGDRIRPQPFDTIELDLDTLLG